MKTENQENQKGAIVLRQGRGGEQTMFSVENNEVSIGWSKSKGLIETEDWNDFKNKVGEAYNHYGNRGLGAAAGSLWRFIKEVNEGDYVIVPYESKFYVGEIKSGIKYDKKRVESENAYRREVKWLNNGESKSRNSASAALQMRMKSQQTCVRASDLVKDIELLLGDQEDRSFGENLHRKLLKETHDMLTSGNINSKTFEKLIIDLLKHIGANEIEHRGSSSDKGADIVASIGLLGVSELTLAIQAKHYKPDPPIGRNVIDQLKKGMGIEGADLGWVVTTGEFSDDAKKYVEELYNGEDGILISLIDGQKLSELILENSLSGKLLVKN